MRSSRSVLIIFGKPPFIRIRRVESRAKWAVPPFGKSECTFVSTHHRCFSSSLAALVEEQTISKDHNDETLFASNRDAVRCGSALLKNVPRGKFSDSQFQTARAVVDHLKHQSSVTVAQVELCMDLLERLVAETSMAPDPEENGRWLGNPEFYVPILNHWKVVSKAHPLEADSPKTVTKRLYKMSAELPFFKLTSESIGVILDVLIQRSPPEEAPLAASKLVDFLQASDDPSLQPNLHIYTQLISAWAESGRPEAGERVDAIVKNMLQKQISPSRVTYSKLLKFWSRTGDVRRCDATLRRMELHGLGVDMECGQHIVEGYIKAGRLSDADSLLRRMMSRAGETDEGAGKLVLSVCRVLQAHKLGIEAGGLKEHSMLPVERLLKDFSGCAERLAEIPRARVYHYFMDVLAVGRKYSLVEELFELLDNPTEASYGVLINSYGMSGRSELALKKGKQLLEDSDFRITSSRVLNAVVQALAISDKAGAVDQAFEFLRCIDHSPRCQEFGIKPDNFTFSALLKCVLFNFRYQEDPGKTVREILDEKKRRKLEPDSVTMTLAIKIAMAARDYALADDIMQEMERSRAPPTIVTYINILHHWARVGSKAAAERTESILAHMKQLSKANPELRPNTAAYGIVVKAWALSGSSEASQRIWNLYELAKEDGHALDSTLYHTMISYFCATGEHAGVQRADDLILAMERTTGRRNRPLSKHYNQVAKAWFELEDSKRVTNLMLRQVSECIKNQNGDANPTPKSTHSLIELFVRGGEFRKATYFIEKVQKLFDAKLLPSRPINVASIIFLREAWETSDHEGKKSPDFQNLTNQIKKYQQR